MLNYFSGVMAGLAPIGANIGCPRAFCSLARSCHQGVYARLRRAMERVGVRGASLSCGGDANSSPPPCGEGVGGGGRERRHGIATTSRPPPPSLPHKGGGSRSGAATA